MGTLGLGQNQQACNQGPTESKNVRLDFPNMQALPQCVPVVGDTGGADGPSHTHLSLQQQPAAAYQHKDRGMMPRGLLC